jgi:hypothetical protein
MLEKKFNRIVEAWPKRSRWLVSKTFLTKLQKREKATESARRNKDKKKKEALTGDGAGSVGTGGASVAGSTSVAADEPGDAAQAGL